VGRRSWPHTYVAHMCCTFVAQRTRVGQPVWPRVIQGSRILNSLMLNFLYEYMLWSL
jgi:hypothetical protein